MGWMLNDGSYIQSPKPTMDDLAERALEGIDKTQAAKAKEMLSKKDDENED